MFENDMFVWKAWYLVNEVWGSQLWRSYKKFDKRRRTHVIKNRFANRKHTCNSWDKNHISSQIIRDHIYTESTEIFTLWELHLHPGQYMNSRPMEPIILSVSVCVCVNYEFLVTCQLIIISRCCSSITFNFSEKRISHMQTSELKYSTRIQKSWKIALSIHQNALFPLASSAWNVPPFIKVKIFRLSEICFHWYCSAIVNDQTSENDAREQRVCHRIFGTLISNWMVARWTQTRRFVRFRIEASVTCMNILYFFQNGYETKSSADFDNILMIQICLFY